MFDQDLPGRTAKLPFPTPQPAVSQMFEDLGQFVRKSSMRDVSKGNGGTGESQYIKNLHTNFKEERVDGYEHELPMSRSLFSSPSKFSNIQRSLSSIHNAKSFVYSANFFGTKKFYSDEFDFKKTPLHPSDRRKIRFGLKSLVDFVIQLDLYNLKELLLESDERVEKFTTRLVNEQNTRFSDDSFFGLLDLANPCKRKRMSMILERIISNLHFSQSMTEFMASDVAIEAPKIVISEAVKRGPDLGNFLRGGSFASCVQVYRNLSSKFDFDAAFFIAQKNSHQQNNMYSQNYNRNVLQKRNRLSPYPTGFCYRFQNIGSCAISGCKYKHFCSNCEDKNHGAENCPQIGSARRSTKLEKSSEIYGK